MNILANLRLLSFKKILFFPHTLNRSEKTLFISLAGLALLSGGWLFSRIYIHYTIPAPKVGSSYTEGLLREPRHINPLYSSTETDRDISRLVYGRLLTYRGDGSMTPDLAENYYISEDGKTYTVILRKNLYWHDGYPLMADDVLFTIRTIQNPLYKSPLRPNWQGVTVEKVNEYTVSFILRTPYAPFVENLAVGIIPKHLWENIPPERILLHELNLKPVGSGPFKFSRLKHNKDGAMLWYELERNGRYYKEGPYLKKITFRFFKNEDELLTAWHRKRIDGFGSVLADKKEELKREKNIVLTMAMPRIFGIFFNAKKSSVLEEKTVREAIASAIDKEEVLASVATRGVIPVDSLFPPATPGFISDVTVYPFDPEKSMVLLEKDGWKDLDGDGILDKKLIENKNEVTRSLRLTLATSDWADLVRVAGIVKSSLEKIGIEVTIVAKPFHELEGDIIRPRNYDMLLFGQVYGYEPDPFAFWHSSQVKDPGLNVSSYASRAADALLEEARQTFDPHEREKKYQELQRLVSADLPALFLYSQLYTYMLPANIKGMEAVKISLPADRFNEANLWHIKTRRILRR